MSDVTLTASVRTNLNALSTTSTMLEETSERLATGNKVNSALDNPNSFFTASSLNSRASDLGNLQDDVGQAVSTIEAADNGITAISELVDAAEAKANQALQTDDVEERATYEAQYNELLTQIEDIAGDSGYKGKNLLGGDGNDLDVKFNEDGSSNLDVQAVDYTDITNESSGDLYIAEVDVGDYNVKSIDLGENTKGSTKLTDLEDFTDGDEVKVTVDGTATTLKIVDDYSTTPPPAGEIKTVDDLQDALEAAGTGTWLEDGELSFYAGSEVKFEEGAATPPSSNTSLAALGSLDVAAGEESSVGSWTSDEAIEESLSQLDKASSNLRAQASTFGTNLSVVNNRSDFTAEMINTLEMGAGKLTLADMNEESANLSALQTQQSIATSTLSIATQANQSVLQLIQ